MPRTSEPTLSVGLPVYNGERYLADALDSLLAQSFEDFELIISDNASTDSTGRIAGLYASRDHRIRYVRQDRNVGVARNFNTAFRLGTGRYFKWAAYDDLVHPTFVERCVHVLERDNSVVLAFSRSRQIGSDGQHLSYRSESLHLMQSRPSERLKHIYADLQLCDAQYGVIRTDVLRRTAGYRNFVGADVCLLTELSLHGKFCELPEYLFARRFHPAASTALDGGQLAAFWDTGVITGSTLQMWRHVIANVEAVVRAPLPPGEKVRCLGVVGRQAIWDRARLAREIGQATRTCVGRGRTRTGDVPPAHGPDVVSDIGPSDPTKKPNGTADSHHDRGTSIHP